MGSVQNPQKEVSSLIMYYCTPWWYPLPSELELQDYIEATQWGVWTPEYEYEYGGEA